MDHEWFRIHLVALFWNISSFLNMPRFDSHTGELYIKLERKNDLYVCSLVCHISPISLVCEHIAKKTKVANSIVAIISKSFVNLTSEFLTTLYKAVVRTHLKNANQAWNPYLKKDKITIENVQRRATKFIPGIRKNGYSKNFQF